MEINRRGTLNDQGEYSVELKNPTVKWDSKTNALIVSAQSVPDFGYSQAHHNYRIVISLPEFAEQLQAVSTAAQGPDAAILSASLAPNLSDFLHIALACAGSRATQD